MEHWKTVQGFEDYEISNLGRLKSHKYNRTVVLKPRITHDGYVWYSLCKNGKGCTKRANRLVAEAFIANPDKKPTVNHIDGNKLNNNVSNLEWATKEEQMQHAYENGLKKPVRGCLQGNHVLSEDEVREIRSTYKAHDKQNGMRALAKRYGVSEPTIDKCVRRVSYKNID
jgi:predicted DNA binding protein